MSTFPRVNDSEAMARTAGSRASPLGARPLRSNPATKAMKIVAISGKKLSGSQQDFLVKNCDKFLQKPFEIEELIARVKAVLRRRQGGAPEEEMVLVPAGPFVMGTEDRAGNERPAHHSVPPNVTVPSAATLHART